MSTELHDRRVRVVPAIGDAAPQPREAAEVLPVEGLSTVRRLTSAPAFNLAWAASLPVAGGGLVCYAALHCFVC